MSELNFLSATAMAEQVRRKKISPIELVEAHLARIQKLNPVLNAFVELDSDRAREQARLAEAAVAHGRRLQWRRSGSHRVRLFCGRSGQRWRRLHPRARALHRHLRP